MASSFSPRLFNPKIFIATILAVVMSSVGAYAQRASAPIHKRAETTASLCPEFDMFLARCAGSLCATSTIVAFSGEFGRRLGSIRPHSLRAEYPKIGQED